MNIFMVQRRLSVFIFVIAKTCSMIAPIGEIDNEDNNSGNNANFVIAANSPQPAQRTAPPHLRSHSSTPFKPGIAVIVGVLTTMFSITFLLLLYAKHCKRRNAYDNGGPTNSRGGTAHVARKNSGVDRVVVDSLPIFRFGSLRGHKDGLECAVCLNRFEPTEVLRLLPKCKHAFHVECVDTWLDAHNTCPLCRYRVDPEDILLVENDTPPPPQPPPPPEPEDYHFRRVSGRHSSAGERDTGNLQVIVQRPSDSTRNPRRSLDGFQKKNNNGAALKCFDRHRKDGLLLAEGLALDRTSLERRFEHRIIVSAGASGLQQRWSDVQPSDLLYLRSEMIISDSRRLSLGSRPHPRQHELVRVQQNREGINGTQNNNGRMVINSRSVSEITGLSRFSERTSNYNQQLQEQERHNGLVSRWLAWIGQSRTSMMPDGRSGSRAPL